MERIVGTISLAIFLRTVVGIGWRLQCELVDWKSKSKISDRVAEVKWWSTGGGVDCKKWARVDDGLDCKLRWSFYILSAKNVFGTFAVEQKEERKRVESIRQFCEGYCLWYSRECENLRKRSGWVRSRINAWRQEFFYDIGWWQCVEYSSQK